MAFQVTFDDVVDPSAAVNAPPNHISAIDLCCGAGGLTAGLLQAGIQVLGGVDKEEYAIDTYKQNFNLPIYRTDICDATVWDICAFFGTSPKMIDLVVAAPPPFGMGPKSSIDRKEEGRRLLWACVRLITELRPRLFVLEYPALRGRLRTKILDPAIDMLTSAGYQIHQSELNALRYGVPQHRWRYYYVGQRDHHHLPFLWPVPVIDEHSAVPMWGAIRDLPPPSSMMAFAQDPLHCDSSLTKVARERLHIGLAASDASGSPSFMDKRRSSFRKVQRLHPGQPVQRPGITPTFTQLSSFDIFVHPFENRTLTLREGARLQTFRDDFKFIPGRSRSDRMKLEKLIGSATPPRLAAHLGQALADHLELVARLPVIGRRQASPPPSRSWGLLGQHTFQLLPTPSPELRYLLGADDIPAGVVVAQLLHHHDQQLPLNYDQRLDSLETQEVWESSRDRIDHALARYHDLLKLCEMMGLCYQGADHQIHVTTFGTTVFRRLDHLNEQNSQSLCNYAVQALAVCQLPSPVHSVSHVAADKVFPFVCIWRALLALDGWLSTEEINRALLQVMAMKELEPAILRIAQARSVGDVTHVGPPAIPHSQAMSHVHTWMSLASFGWTLVAPEYVSADAWCYRIRSSATTLLKRVVRSRPRKYPFSNVHAYVTYVAKAAGVPEDVR